MTTPDILRDCLPRVTATGVDSFRVDMAKDRLERVRADNRPSATSAMSGTSRASLSPGAIRQALDRSCHIDRLKREDAAIFRKLTASEAAAGLYGNSWCYIMQAAGCLPLGVASGYRYYDGKRFAGIGYFPRPASEPRSHHFHVVRPVGAWSRGDVEALCGFLCELSGTPVYLKKLTPRQHAEWVGPRFKRPLDYPWHPAAPLEDDTFPEVCLDLGCVLPLLEAGATDNELRRKFRRFERDYVNLAEWRSYTPDLFPQAWRVVEGFFSMPPVQQRGLSCAEDYRNMLTWLPAGSNDTDFFASLLYLGSEPAALFVADRVNPDTAGVYANLTASRRWRGLSEYLLLCQFRQLRQAGIVTVNLGGSETPGLDRFKRKFRPSGDQQMHWLVFD